MRYADALRCIGQALQDQNIEVFELETEPDEFRAQCGDPNPPYTDLIEIRFSLDQIKNLDREGHARRGQRGATIRFDSVPAMLRAVGDYIDKKHGYLLRLGNTRASDSGLGALEIEYETIEGDARSENLSMSFIREGGVRVYKKRTRLSKPISILTRAKWRDT